MVTVINDNRVKDVAAYIPFAKAFAEDSVKNDKGCLSMKVFIDHETEGRVVFMSTWDSSDDFKASVGGATFNKHIPNMGPYYISGTDTFLEEA